MHQYIGYIIGFFVGMAVSDIIWMNKFGILTLWKARWKTWRARKLGK